MPMQMTVLPEYNLVYTRLFGRSTPEMLRKAQNTYLEPGRRPHGRLILVNLKGLEQNSVTVQDLDRFLEAIRHHDFACDAAEPPKKDHLVFLAPNALSYSLTRQLQAMADSRGGIHVHIARDERELIALVDVSQDPQHVLLAEIFRTNRTASLLYWLDTAAAARLLPVD